jgi:hypothetical protein
MVNSENIAKVNEAADSVAKASAEWRGTSAPLALLQPVHQDMRSYMELFNDACAHLTKGFPTSDPQELGSWWAGMRDAYAAKKRASAGIQELVSKYGVN